MQPISQQFEKLWIQIRQYVDTRITLLKLKATDTIAGIVSNVLVLLLIIISLLLGVIVLSLGLALWLNHVLNSGYAGLLVVGFMYVIIALVLFAMRKHLFRIVLSRYILRKMMKLND